ncbi:hypothetical protein SMACR_04553 [Sordaria macrospora]|uniref:WGS project CABT00000000 data, contig 2.20 n=2 Tax=Sordaria macrospora TaxID=5147 RepID=F7W1T0_SORMK|nr:uncharacterized protein SMAC_04553 [Sordaria macrospora k-hell]KAA8630058.1 hypothetical protein SMACR_04553 [Sordaria macrospora]KAH7631447.1 hypothetical protein B0T09DRAFT_103832 [Sordaria sp. MPI-SDFR-AT-0083]WPJ62773.1 hypothetical protein SMAC4_04553 [Sordaria macrospora]CCC11565.1 unnamed protein product [Sordaria macrospora k-hell]
MSAEQQDQRPKSSASSKKSVTRKSEDNQQRGHQLSDDGPVAPGAGAAGGNADAYQQLSDDQPETSSENGEQKADKPKKENPLKKFIASLKSLNCAGKPANFDKKGNKDGGEKNDEDDDENTPNARPVSQSSLESKKVVTEKNAPQIEVSPSVEDHHHDGSKGDKDGEDEKKEEHHSGEKSPVDAPLTTTTISATPPTL